MIEKLEFDRFVFADYNPRTITDDALEKLKNSIKAHSQVLGDNGILRLVDPIIINKANGVLVSGHQRVKALQSLGQDFIAKDDVRYIYTEDIAKEKALNIVLNNQEVTGDFDFNELQKVIEDIKIDVVDTDDFNNLTGLNFEDWISEKQEELVENIEEESEPIQVEDLPKGNKDSLPPAKKFIRLEFSEERFEKMNYYIEEAKKMMGIENQTDILFNSVRDYVNNYTKKQETK